LDALCNLYEKHKLINNHQSVETHLMEIAQADLRHIPMHTSAMRTARESIKASVALATVASAGLDPCSAAKWYRHVMSSHEFVSKMFRGNGGWDKQLKTAKEALPKVESACKSAETRPGRKDIYGKPDMWSASPATAKAWVISHLQSRKVTAQAAGCSYVEEVLYTFTKRADGQNLLPTVNTLIREGGVLSDVVDLANFAKTSKVRHECLRALSGFPQRPVYQDFLWGITSLQALLTGGMKQPRRMLVEGDNGESTFHGGHRTLVSVTQPLHVYILRIACKAIVGAKLAPKALLKAGVATLCVQVLTLSPNTEAIKVALLTLSNLAAKGYRKEVGEVGTIDEIERRTLGSHPSSDIRHLVHILSTNMQDTNGLFETRVVMDDAVGGLVVVQGAPKANSVPTRAEKTVVREITKGEGVDGKTGVREITKGEGVDGNEVVEGKTSGVPDSKRMKNDAEEARDKAPSLKSNRAPEAGESPVEERGGGPRGSEGGSCAAEGGSCLKEDTVVQDTRAVEEEVVEEEPRRKEEAENGALMDGWLSLFLAAVTIMAPIAGLISYRLSYATDSHNPQDVVTTPRRRRRPGQLMRAERRSSEVLVPEPEPSLEEAPFVEASPLLSPASPKDEQGEVALSNQELLGVQGSPPEGSGSSASSDHDESPPQRAKQQQQGLGGTPSALDLSSPSPSEEVEASEECVVCHDAGKEAAFFPCGHKCVCVRCAGMLHHRKASCPMCRTRIKQFARIFDT